MLSPTVQSGLFGFLLLLLIAAAFWRRHAFLFLAGFLLPLLTPRLTLGIGVDWYKIIGPISAILYVVRPKKSKGPAELRALTWWLGWVTLVTLIWMAAEYSTLQRYWLARAMGLGEGQSYYKMPVQLGSFIGVVLCGWTVSWHARTVRDVDAAIKGMGAGLITSTTFGVVLFLATGQGMLSDNERQGIIAIGGEQFGRVGGLSGEPKFLGSALVALLMLKLSELVFSRRPTRAEIGYALILALGLFATFSTSAWVAAGVGVSVLLYTGVRRTAQSRAWRLVPAVFVVLAVGATTPVFWEVVEARLGDRLLGQSSQVEKQKDMLLLEVLERKPIHGIYGFGFGGTDLEVIPFVPELHRRYRRTPTAAVTGMRLLGDTGIVGLLALILVFIRWSRRLSRSSPSTSAFLVAGGAASLSCSILALPCFLFLAGALLTKNAMEQSLPPPEPGSK